MENYKAYHYKSETSEILGIDTKIPTYVVSQINQALNNMNGYLATPVMVDSKDRSVVFGIIDIKDNTLKCKVSITPND
jgi:hypothetical protein